MKEIAKGKAVHVPQRLGVYRYALKRTFKGLTFNVSIEGPPEADQPDEDKMSSDEMAQMLMDTKFVADRMAATSYDWHVNEEEGTYGPDPDYPCEICGTATDLLDCECTSNCQCHNRGHCTTMACRNCMTYVTEEDPNDPDRDWCENWMRKCANCKNVSQ
jgi:hypothetical protein